MYHIKISTHFSSAHSLRYYRGKCEKLHGHNWKVEVTVEARELDDLGMVMDFKDLKSAVNEVLQELDHAYLNDLPYFREHNPSSEEIARYLYLRVKERVSRDGRRVHEVRVWETDTACAVYFERK
ncbi:MAG: 6-carboxytetrahydropterin synthase QueD [Candidatus Omnitrophica bacterium]|nr:6-carboxytetrahydropterin synthase QueD [Candidatus Omnitrophota bacterium]